MDEVTVKEPEVKKKQVVLRKEAFIELWAAMPTLLICFERCRIHRLISTVEREEVLKPVNKLLIELGTNKIAALITEWGGKRCRI